MSLSDEVLPLVRTRSDLHRWRAADAYGVQLHQAVALLRQAAENEPLADVLTVTQEAITNACKHPDGSFRMWPKSRRTAIWDLRPPDFGRFTCVIPTCLCSDMSASGPGGQGILMSSRTRCIGHFENHDQLEDAITKRQRRSQHHPRSQWRIRGSRRCTKPGSDHQCHILRQ